ncbi:MAG TPA: LiaF domain-containing protein [Actinomycetota bacterium]|nr:LiaF domain-containing protein [Actinomycetota bacterium]
MLGLVLVLFGVGWLLEALGVDVPWDIVFPAVLIGIGIMLVSSARSGAGQVGLMVAGIVLTILLVLGTAIDIPLGGGVGDRTVRPSAERIEPEYERGIGKLTLDLTEVAFGAIDVPLDVRARVGIGQLVVIVPADAPVRVDARSGIGSVRIYGQEEAGFGAGLSAPAPTGAPAIKLEATVGIGEVRIDHG